jgi:DNA modification methylase
VRLQGLQMVIAEQHSLFDLPILTPLEKKTMVRSARSGTFTDNMKLPVHRWYRYSAGFSAQWVEQLIREYAPSSVLDPFVGSGTTLLAASAAGVRAYGYESHPYWCKVCMPSPTARAN